VVEALLEGEIRNSLQSHSPPAAHGTEQEHHTGHGWEVQGYWPITSPAPLSPAWAVQLGYLSLAARLRSKAHRDGFGEQSPTVSRRAVRNGPPIPIRKNVSKKGNTSIKHINIILKIIYCIHRSQNENLKGRLISF